MASNGVQPVATIELDTIDDPNKNVQSVMTSEPTRVNKTKSNLKKKQTTSKATNVFPVRVQDIKDHQTWALASSVFCFFLIAPVIAYYHSRRVAAMKQNQELERAKKLSDHISSLLMFSSIVGIIIWVAILFVIGVSFIAGFFWR